MAINACHLVVRAVSRHDAVPSPPSGGKRRSHVVQRCVYWSGEPRVEIFAERECIGFRRNRDCPSRMSGNSPWQRHRPGSGYGDAGMDLERLKHRQDARVRLAPLLITHVPSGVASQTQTSHGGTYTGTVSHGSHSSRRGRDFK